MPDSTKKTFGNRVIALANAQTAQENAAPDARRAATEAVVAAAAELDADDADAFPEFVAAARRIREVAQAELDGGKVV